MVSQVVWLEIFLCCFKWRVTPMERIQIGSSPWNFFVELFHFSMFIMSLSLCYTLINLLVVLHLCLDLMLWGLFLFIQFNIVAKRIKYKNKSKPCYGNVQSYFISHDSFVLIILGICIFESQRKTWLITKEKKNSRWNKNHIKSKEKRKMRNTWRTCY